MSIDARVSDERCVWQVVMNNPQSTTREDAIKYENKTLRQCVSCYNANPAICANYRVHRLIERYAT